MKTLTIADTVYNLAFLITVTYKAKTKVAARKDSKSDDAESLKSASSLALQFLDCDTIHLKKDKADMVWAKLTTLMDLETTESLPTADDSHPS